MSFFRYYSETKDADGDSLWWPGGTGGFPFRGPAAPSLTQHEYENLSLSGKFRCKLFKLWEPEDYKQYCLVRERCSNGRWVLLDKDRQWREDKDNYTIYLEWLELAYDLPTVGGKNAKLARTNTPITEGTSITLPYKSLAGLSDEIW